MSGTRCVPLSRSVCSYECMSVTVQGQQGHFFPGTAHHFYHFFKIRFPTALEIATSSRSSGQNLPFPLPITRIASMYHHALHFTWMVESNLGIFGWIQTFHKVGGSHLPSLPCHRSGRLSTWVFQVPF